ncbi:MULTISPECIES: aminotransferase class I/II-fold pyridoxal phosphate-dependent enzyme [unclassified Rhodococcus (in: high G+C Gram-positive bacteria)]|uniref:aminotransferase class I/II-fold pyridoxal phosphate-dependent enzyme n=1 Tax=unclassified Rhodococcus (in: high G+C Gram-positive bacteria) TaxID=192944 RepID=UPI00117AA03E|nr:MULTISPECIES: PLP-dependent aminotransferase family protein [unclassified Rhodococcus (in: high G+C Gram-positive bacteria)]
MPTGHEPAVSAAWLCAQLTEMSAPELASCVHRLVKTGDIPRGSALPTVRALASRMHVSPATISTAWGILRRQNVIDGSGRQGTWVVDGHFKVGPPRYETVGKEWRAGVLDLTLAPPDPALLPDLATAVHRSGTEPGLNSYRKESITDRLRDAVSPSWPWETSALVSVNGGYHGLLLVTSATVVAGDYVAVADPSAPRVLDILDHLGARMIPIPCDSHGPDPVALSRALERRPVAFLYEPRASSRMGVSVNAARRDELAGILRKTDLTIIEQDDMGEVSDAMYNGLGPVFPERTVLIRTYSKSHGPDLRLAIVGGAGELVGRAHDLRQFGDRWTSRLLQNALAWMLTDGDTRKLIAEARTEYRARRETLAAMFAREGITVSPGDGLSVNVPVFNERASLLALASHGIAANGSSGSSIRRIEPSLRLAVGASWELRDQIVAAYAAASGAGR